MERWCWISKDCCGVSGARMDLKCVAREAAWSTGWVAGAASGFDMGGNAVGGGPTSRCGDDRVWNLDQRNLAGVSAVSVEHTDSQDVLRELRVVLLRALQACLYWRIRGRTILEGSFLDFAA